jgi:flagellar assembly factor FliW
MRVETTKFGILDVSEDKIYYFPEPILGFPDCKRYFVIQNPKFDPFLFLQAVDSPALAFMVTNPYLFFPDYRVNILKEELLTIGLEDVADGVVLVILTYPGDIKRTTANLLGPVILNPKRLLARQFILNEPFYSTKHLIFNICQEGDYAGPNKKT